MLMWSGFLVGSSDGRVFCIGSSDGRPGPQVVGFFALGPQMVGRVLRWSGFLAGSSDGRVLRRLESKSPGSSDGGLKWWSQVAKKPGRVKPLLVILAIAIITIDNLEKYLNQTTHL